MNRLKFARSSLLSSTGELNPMYEPDASRAESMSAEIPTYA